jgi:membrane associated rhomboid family serine protease
MSSYSMRPSAFFGGPVTKTVKRLIIINAAVYVLLFITIRFGSGFLLSTFGLIPEQITYQFMIWQFVSYMFLHADFFHILVNMFTLFMFGNDLERRWGTRRFLEYYMITGVGAGVCSWIVDVTGQSVIIGASGAVFAVLLAYGLYYPNRIVYIYLLFPVKVKWLVIVLGVMNFMSLITGANTGIAHMAHLGGMLIGFFLIRGEGLLEQIRGYQRRRRKDELKKQFEVYYGEIRSKIDEENKKKGPTIH